MIQRKQTVYLLAAVLLSVVCLCMQIGSFHIGELPAVKEYNLLLTESSGFHHFGSWPLFVVLTLSASVGVYTIFLYSNRIVQARFCVFCMLLIIGWYILYAVLSKIMIADARNVSFEPEWPGLLPMAALVFYFIARQAILADEKLVRAADRIR